MVGVQMVGPRISVHVFGTRVAFGAIDLVLAALVLIGVLRERMDPSPNLILAAPAGLALVIVCLLVNLLSERLRLRINRSGAPALPTIVALPVANGPTVAEAKSSTLAARGGAAGMGIDLAIGLIAVAVFLLVDGDGRTLGDLAAVAAIAIGGSAGIRFLAAPSLNGGRVMRWMMEFTFDDEESAVRITRMVGYGVSVVLFTAGILLLASEGACLRGTSTREIRAPTVVDNGDPDPGKLPIMDRRATDVGSSVRCRRHRCPPPRRPSSSSTTMRGCATR